MLKHIRRLSLKKYLLLFFILVLFSYGYSFAIALLFSEDYTAINYSFNAGLSLSIIGSIALYMIYKIDAILHHYLLGNSKSTILLNFLISLTCTSLVFFIISWFLNLMLRKNIGINFSFIKEQIVIINYLFILILSYHTIAYFTRAIAEKNKELKADNLELSVALNKYLKRLPSVVNKKTTLIPVDEVVYFRIESGIVFAYLSNGLQKPLSITTLNALESKLNPTVFFRINRSEIVHLDKIASHEPYFKDRLAIKLIDKTTILYTSNSKSAAFRKWLVNPSNY